MAAECGHAVAPLFQVHRFGADLAPIDDEPPPGSARGRDRRVNVVVPGADHVDLDLHRRIGSLGRREPQRIEVQIGPDVVAAPEDQHLAGKFSQPVVADPEEGPAPSIVLDELAREVGGEHPPMGLPVVEVVAAVMAKERAAGVVDHCVVVVAERLDLAQQVDLLLVGRRARQKVVLIR